MRHCNALRHAARKMHHARNGLTVIVCARHICMGAWRTMAEHAESMTAVFTVLSTHMIV